MIAAHRLVGLILSLSSIVALTANRAMAEPFTGEAAEPLFCDTQSQFCDVNELNPAGGTFDLVLQVPKFAAGNATFTLTAFGDFENATEETFCVSIEGFDLGFFLNSNPGDDLFGNESFGDVGNDFISPRTASATIPHTTLSAIIADGLFEVTFDSSTGKNDIQGIISATIPNQNFDEFISYRLSFEAVPEPTFLGLAALSFLSACLRRRTLLPRRYETT